MISKFLAGVAFGALGLAASLPTTAVGQSLPYKRVLLISIDGMHAIDFANCAKGLPGVNGGASYCPNLAGLADHGVTYLAASTPRPSDSFPGLTAIVTGGTPRSTGAFYDVSYDRSLSPPAHTTPYGIPGGPGLCPGTVGTQVGNDEEIDINYLKLDAGGGINPNYLPRDPKNFCQPVYPHDFVRVNSIFGVIKAAGGYTAWSDKHQSYELVRGHGGPALDDYYAPEINSIPVALPTVKLLPCSPLPDQTAVSSSNAWTDSFANVKCYDALKVQAVLNEISGYDHTGAKKTKVPTIFGMNFQAVSVGQKLVEKAISTTGGYQDADGTPSPVLASQIQFVDNSIGLMINRLIEGDLLKTTLVIITAKHGQSPIDPNRINRIPADQTTGMPPSAILGSEVVQALEDDVSLLWLSPSNPATTKAAVSALEANATTIGANAGEIYSGQSLDLFFNDPAIDPRTPNVIVTPNIGVTYTGGKKKLAEHGGFSHDDTNVMMLVASTGVSKATVSAPVTTMQVAPTILKALGLQPYALQSVQQEGTEVLPRF